MDNFLSSMIKIINLTEVYFKHSITFQHRFEEHIKFILDINAFFTKFQQIIPNKKSIKIIGVIKQVKVEY